MCRGGGDRDGGDVPRVHREPPHVSGRGHRGDCAGGPPVLHLGLWDTGEIRDAYKGVTEVLQGAPSVYTDIAAVRDWVDFILSKYQD